MKMRKPKMLMLFLRYVLFLIKISFLHTFITNIYQIVYEMTVFFSFQQTVIDDITAFKSSLPLFPLVPPYHSQPTKSKLQTRELISVLSLSFLRLPFLCGRLSLEFENCSFCVNLLSTMYLDVVNEHFDQHLISLHIATAESFIKIVRLKEMIANLRSFDC